MWGSTFWQKMAEQEDVLFSNRQEDSTISDSTDGEAIVFIFWWAVDNKNDSSEGPEDLIIQTLVGKDKFEDLSALTA